MVRQFVGVVSLAFAAAVALPAVAALPDTYYPLCVDKTEVVIWKGVSLADLSGVDAFLCGASLDAAGRPATCYHWTYDASAGTATAQFQIWDGTYTKCVKVLFTQDGTDVKAQYVYGKYIGKNVIGSDFDTLSGTTTLSTSPTLPSDKDYGIYCLSPILTASPLTRGCGEEQTWNSGTDWFGTSAWLSGSTATAWRAWATPVFTKSATITVDGLARIASWNKTLSSATVETPVVTIPANVEITLTGTGAVANRGSGVTLGAGAKLTSNVPWVMRTGQDFTVTGPGEMSLPPFCNEPSMFKIANGAKVTFTSAGTTSGRPQQVGYDNVLDLGGGSWGALPSWSANSSCTYLNGTYNSTSDWNLPGNSKFVIADGCTFNQNARMQFNNGHIEVRDGGIYNQINNESTAYGTFTGLDANRTYNTLTVNGGTVNINTNRLGQVAGGFMIACKGGSYNNTTGVVTIARGKATVATIMMTTDWVAGNNAKGWHGGSNGKLIQTGGELVTWKIFAGNTTNGGTGGDVQSWSFTGGTGTIGSIRNGVYTPLDFTFDGYTVKPYENVDRWFVQDNVVPVCDAKKGLQHFTIGTKGLTIDTDGKTMGVDFSIWTINGPITKAGAGTLRIDSDLAGVAVNVTGGTLAFSRPATVGAVTLADGTTLAATTGATGVQALTATSVTLPETGTATIKLTGTAPANGTYPLLVAPGLDAARFTLDTSALTGGTATLVAGDNGSLAVEVTESTMPYTYRGTTTDTLWGGTGLVWLNGLGATVAWANSAHVVFDGAGAAGVKADSAVTAGDVTFNGANDFTLAGTNTISGTGTITKNGTGTLTLDGANFAAQPIVINVGQVVLGTNAGAKSLGTDTGAAGANTVKINAGGQFNLNYTPTSANNTDARAEITQLKTFQIAGDGADHRGAIVNDALDGRTTHNSVWNSAFRRIELTDDATIGGIDRFDVRVRSGTSATAPGGIYGAGKNLTIKNTGFFGVVGQPIDVGSLTLTDGGVLRPEGLGESQWSIPGGITLDNGTFQGYNSTLPATIALNVTANGGELSGQYSTTTFKGPLTVAEDGELTRTGSQTFTFQGGVTNNGAVTVKGGDTNFTAGQLDGDGEWNVAGGNLFWYGAFNLGKPRTVNLSSGVFFYGKETDDIAPLSHKVTVEATGGEVAFNIGKSVTLSSANLEIKGNPATLGLMSRNDDTTYVTLKDFAATTKEKVVVGDGSNGRYIFDSGTDLTSTNFYLNGNNKISDLTMKAGSSVTVSGVAKVGNNSAATSTMTINGGTFTQTGTQVFELGPNATKIDVTLNDGTLTVYGLQCREGWKDPASFSEQFTMNGGTLNMNGDALRAWTHFNHFCAFNNGTLNSLKDWHVEQMRTSAFGDKAGGHVDFKLNDKTVNWATGLSGAADVTLSGTGTFKSGSGENSNNLFLQGIVSGKWTVKNTGKNDFSGASAFLGGLELATNVAATVHIAGSNLVEAVYLQTSATSINLGDSLKQAYPFACNDLKTMHYYEGQTFNKGQFMWQGLFYADTAGTWTFAGSYDDTVYFEVDGTAVIASYSSFSKITTGQATLTTGWHTFRLVQYQNGGSWGTPVAGWTKVMNLGFAKKATTSTAVGDYTRFDNHNLPMKAGPVAATKKGLVNWSSVKGYNSGTWKTRTDLKSNGTYTMSSLNTYNVAATPTFSGSTHQFDGWFFVYPEQAGDWSVNVNYDDQGALWIDGVDTGASGGAGTKTVVTVKGMTPGWHSFKLRVADNSGNWGPWSNAGTCVKITVNGTTYKFDETAFYFSTIRPAEYAGLDGVLTLRAGATLTNDATVDACPIWGTLAGEGTLSGLFAFVGTQNAWQVTGAGNKRALRAVTFADSGLALAGLCKLQVTFDAKPGCSLFEVGAALGADPAQIAIEVKDVKGIDYTDAFSLTVSNGKLVLRNAHPSGSVMIIR